MANQQSTVKEYNVRAAGGDRSFQKFVLGKFPLGPPELKAQGTAWRKSERDCYVAKPERCGLGEVGGHVHGSTSMVGRGLASYTQEAQDPRVQLLLAGSTLASLTGCSSGTGSGAIIPENTQGARQRCLLPQPSPLSCSVRHAKGQCARALLLRRTSTSQPAESTRPSSRQWVLDDASNAAVQPVLVGQPEAGMGDGGSGAGYFLLIRHRGSDDFLALPVSEWQNFKPLQQRQHNRCGGATRSSISRGLGVKEHCGPAIGAFERCARWLARPCIHAMSGAGAQ